MHNLYTRVTTIISYTGTVLFFLAIANGITMFLIKSNPTATVSVASQLVKQMTEVGDRVDVAFVTLNINANLSTAFQWSTKRIFFYVVAEWTGPNDRHNEFIVWDRIISSREEATFSLKGERAKYNLVDHGTNLRGAKISLSCQWSPVPMTGLLIRQRGPSTHIVLPTNYAGYSF